MAERRHSGAIIARAHYCCERPGGRLVWDEHEIRVETRRLFFMTAKSRYYFTYSDYDEGAFLSAANPKVTVFLLNQAIEGVQPDRAHLSWICEAFRGNRLHPFYGQIDLEPIPADRIRWVYLKHCVSEPKPHLPSHVEGFEFELQWNGLRCVGIEKREPLKRTDLEHWDRVLHARGEYSNPVYCALRRVFTPMIYEQGVYERVPHSI